MRAADLMSGRVISTTADTPIATAIRLMLQNRISGLPVLDPAGRLVGMVTEGDFLRRAELGTERRRPDWLEFLLGPGRLADEYVHAHGRTVGDVMTRKVVTVAPNTPAAEIVTLMERHRIKRVPVIDAGDVVGIVTRRNLLQGLAVAAARPATPAGDDGAIRERILHEIQQLPWAPRASLNVVVKDAVAHLWGVILDERQREAIMLAARNVPGVKETHDHLVWVEPMTGMSFDSPEDSAAAKAKTGG